MEAITPKFIIDTVLDFYGLKHSDVERKKENNKYKKGIRKKNIVFVRQVIVFKLSEFFPKFSLQEIGNISTFDYNHASVVYIKKTLEGYLKYDKEMRCDFEAINKIITKKYTPQDLKTMLKEKIEECKNSSEIIEILNHLNFRI